MCFFKELTGDILVACNVGLCVVRGNSVIPHYFWRRNNSHIQFFTLCFSYSPFHMSFHLYLL